MASDEIQHEKDLCTLQEKDIERTDGCPMSFHVRATDSGEAFDSTGIFREHVHILPKTARDSRHFIPLFSQRFTRATLLRRGRPQGG